MKDDKWQSNNERAGKLRGINFRTVRERGGKVS